MPNKHNLLSLVNVLHNHTLLSSPIIIVRICGKLLSQSFSYQFQKITVVSGGH